ncbi:hypothetical protein JOC58_001328 [Paenibacillus hunanensis]|uniref:Uncharacterized protein n=1 Tax=Paenibacillus hunanensis TaxID=539262 RepID=A0ABU1IW46_9BACL|nr:hypothetical protein [Paenibacillus hunanensis]
MKMRKVLDTFMAIILIVGVFVAGCLRFFHSEVWRVLFALLIGSFIALGMYMYIFYPFVLFNWLFK